LSTLRRQHQNQQIERKIKNTTWVHNVATFQPVCMPSWSNEDLRTGGKNKCILNVTQMSACVCPCLFGAMNVGAKISEGPLNTIGTHIHIRCR
ncbi:hypothetical protein GOODEAATRI_003454, partial [Goodea atripinnis]